MHSRDAYQPGLGLSAQGVGDAPLGNASGWRGVRRGEGAAAHPNKLTYIE